MVAYRETITLTPPGEAIQTSTGAIARGSVESIERKCLWQDGGGSGDIIDNVAGGRWPATAIIPESVPGLTTQWTVTRMGLKWRIENIRKLNPGEPGYRARQTILDVSRSSRGVASGP